MPTSLAKIFEAWVSNCGFIDRSLAISILNNRIDLLEESVKKKVPCECIWAIGSGWKKGLIRLRSPKKNPNPGTALCCLSHLSTSSHVTFLGLSGRAGYHLKNPGSSGWNHLPRSTQLVNGRAQAEIQASWPRLSHPFPRTSLGQVMVSVGLGAELQNSHGAWEMCEGSRKRCGLSGREEGTQSMNESFQSDGQAWDLSFTFPVYFNCFCFQTLLNWTL